MAVSVKIPSLIGRLYGAGRHEVLEAATVAELILELDRRFPGLGERLTEPGGALRRWVNIFVDGQDIRELAGPQTALRSDAEVHIVASVAGGG